MDGHSPDQPARQGMIKPYRDVCGRCGAVRIDKQIGLEKTPEAYLEKMVAVFHEVRRVLRSDGSLFCNMGDGYLGKQLTGMPWRLALALQQDGWWLRQDIIWAKVNPMPESVTDRCCKAHEYIFLLTKSAKYFYDAEAVREPTIPDPRDMKWVATETTSRHNHENDLTEGMKQKSKDGFVRMSNPSGRNLRSVWSIPSEAYPEAHFATYPTALVEPCVKAGSSERGCCPNCGAPYKRIVNRKPATSKPCPKTLASHQARGGTGIPTGTVGKSGSGRIEGFTETTGWTATCDCNAGDPVPCTILDIFSGAGTTVMVALRLGRRGIGIELNPQYCEMARERIISDAPILNTPRPAEAQSDDGQLQLEIEGIS